MRTPNSTGQDIANHQVARIPVGKRCAYAAEKAVARSEKIDRRKRLGPRQFRRSTAWAEAGLVVFPGDTSFRKDGSIPRTLLNRLSSRQDRFTPPLPGDGDSFFFWKVSSPPRGKEALRRKLAMFRGEVSGRSRLIAQAASPGVENATLPKIKNSG